MSKLPALGLSKEERLILPWPELLLVHPAVLKPSLLQLLQPPPTASISLCFFTIMFDYTNRTLAIYGDYSGTASCVRHSGSSWGQPHSGNDNHSERTMQRKNRRRHGKATGQDDPSRRSRHEDSESPARIDGNGQAEMEQIATLIYQLLDRGPFSRIFSSASRGLQFRAELFKAFNQANFSNPDT
jgi:hypothetical protein